MKVCKNGERYEETYLHKNTHWLSLEENPLHAEE